MTVLTIIDQVARRSGGYNTTNYETQSKNHLRFTVSPILHMPHNIETRQRGAWTKSRQLLSKPARIRKGNYSPDREWTKFIHIQRAGRATMTILKIINLVARKSRQYETINYETTTGWSSIHQLVPLYICHIE